MNNINEKIKLYFKTRKQRVSVSGVSIQYDWAIVVGCAIALIVLSGIYGIMVYRSISGGRALVSEGEGVSDADRMNNEIAKVVDRLAAER